MIKVYVIERSFAKYWKDIKFLSLLELGRPWNGLIIGIVAVLGVFLFSLTMPSLFDLLRIFLSFFFVYMGGTTLNDVYGIETDKVNMPFRPLQSGRVTLSEAYLFAFSSYIISLLITLSLGFSFLLVYFVFLILSFLYSVPPISLEKSGIIGNLTLAIVTILVPAIAGAAFASNEFNFPQFFWAAILCFTALFWFVSIIKDFKDIKGDKKHGKITFVIRVGRRNAILTCLLGTIIFFPLTIYLFSMFFAYSFIFFIISSAVFICLIYVEMENIKKYEPLVEDRRFSNARLTLLCFIILILFFAISRLL